MNTHTYITHTPAVTENTSITPRNLPWVTAQSWLPFPWRQILSSSTPELHMNGLMQGYTLLSVFLSFYPCNLRVSVACSFLFLNSIPWYKYLTGYSCSYWWPLKWLPVWGYFSNKADKNFLVDLFIDVRDVDLIPESGRSPEEGKATHSSILAWEIPWTEELDRLQSMGSQSGTWLGTHTETIRYDSCPCSILRTTSYCLSF